MQARACWVALSLSHRPLEIRELLDRHGTVEAIFERNLELPGIPSQVARTNDLAQRVMESCQRLGVRVVTFDEASYPATLRTIEQPPAALYTVGDVQLLRRPALAVVGSRRCTAYGRWAARTLSRGISRGGICVVSGMAFGIDEAAHEGAMEGDGGTIAVLAGGPERSSPASLADLYGRLRRDQLVVSEFAPGTRPRPEFFPRRNRVVAGLSRGVMVVEAAQRSGALITARLALESGRDVFAVPGPIDSPSSVGSNRLLRDGATPVLEERDVIETFGLHVAQEGPDPVGRILEALAAGPADAGELLDRTGLTPANLRALLLRMRLHGSVRALGADRYQRVE